MKQYKIINIIGEIALCKSGSRRVYILVSDLPEGAKNGDSLLKDKNDKLHICNIEITPAD
jgi:hypothetical protein